MSVAAVEVALLPSCCLCCQASHGHFCHRCDAAVYDTAALPPLSTPHSCQATATAASWLPPPRCRCASTTGAAITSRGQDRLLTSTTAPTLLTICHRCHRCRRAAAAHPRCGAAANDAALPRAATKLPSWMPLPHCRRHWRHRAIASTLLPLCPLPLPCCSAVTATAMLPLPLPCQRRCCRAHATTATVMSPSAPR